MYNTENPLLQVGSSEFVRPTSLTCEKLQLDWKCKAQSKYPSSPIVTAPCIHELKLLPHLTQTSNVWALARSVPTAVNFQRFAVSLIAPIQAFLAHTQIQNFDNQTEKFEEVKLKPLKHTKKNLNKSKSLSFSSGEHLYPSQTIQSKLNERKSKEKNALKDIRDNISISGKYKKIEIPLFMGC